MAELLLFKTNFIESAKFILNYYLTLLAKLKIHINLGQTDVVTEQTLNQNSRMKIKNYPKLIIIDDDPDLVDLLGSYLSQRGFQVTCFKSAEEALVQIDHGKALVDLILCDLRLPTMDGLEFVMKLKRDLKSPPVILMTGEGDLETSIKALNLGAIDFVLKPLHFPQLLITIQRTILKNELSKSSNENFSLESNSATGVIGRSKGFTEALDMAKRVSNSQANVLIRGESGSGKEIVARAVHEFGDKKSGPFIPINCTAIPEQLLESELFGHAKGAFTGAFDKKSGLFEEANKGTLFLDEIGDLSLPLQAKLLRVLQERKIKRIGENQYREITARIICATHKDLKKEVREGRFREDLYFRLNVIPIFMPPLRKRQEDILPLAEYFLSKYSHINHSKVRTFDSEAIKKLETHHWPGNVRELENTIERAVVLTQGETITVTDLSIEDYQNVNNEIELTPSESISLEEVSRRHIRLIFEKNQRAKEQTARELGIDRKTLYRKLKEMNLESGSVS